LLRFRIIALGEELIGDGAEDQVVEHVSEAGEKNHDRGADKGAMRNWNLYGMG